MGLEEDMRLCGEPNCEDYWIECTSCGGEFCRKCFPGSNLCPACAEAWSAADDAEDRDPDFDDVDDVDALMRENDN